MRTQQLVRTEMLSLLAVPPVRRSAEARLSALMESSFEAHKRKRKKRRKRKLPALHPPGNLDVILHGRFEASGSLPGFLREGGLGSGCVRAPGMRSPLLGVFGLPGEFFRHSFHVPLVSGSHFVVASPEENMKLYC